MIIFKTSVLFFGYTKECKIVNNFKYKSVCVYRKEQLKLQSKGLHSKGRK